MQCPAPRAACTAGSFPAVSGGASTPPANGVHGFAPEGCLFGTLCREVPRAAHAVDPHVLVARTRARVGCSRPAHERRALVERLEARHVGRRQRPVGVRSNRHERVAPAEGVGDVLERGRVEPERSISVSPMQLLKVRRISSTPQRLPIPATSVTPWYP